MRVLLYFWFIGLCYCQSSGLQGTWNTNLNPFREWGTSALDTRTNPPTLVVVGRDSIVQLNGVTGARKGVAITANTGSSIPARYGVWLDINNVWDPVRRKAIVCFQNVNSMIWEIDLDNYTASHVHTIAFRQDVNVTNTFALTACAIDFEKRTAWIGFNNRIRRVYMGDPGTVWNQPSVGGIASTVYQTGPKAGGINMRVAVIDNVTNSIYFGASSANLYRIPRDFAGNMGPNFLFDTYILGAGEIRAMAIDHKRGYMLLGTEFGLGLRAAFPLTTTSNFNLFFLNGEIIRDVYLDEQTGVSFWPTQLANIYRVNPDTFDVFDFTFLNCTTGICAANSVLNIGSGTINPSTNQAFYGTETNPTYMARVQLFDCGVHKSCDDCGSDSFYCGWCVTSQTCTTRQTCPQVSPYIVGASDCPVLTSIDPSSGSSLGNTTVTISGRYFVNDATTKCRFNFNGTTVESPATVLNALSNTSSIVCKTPPAFNSSVQVDILYQGIKFTPSSNSLLFNYYACDGLICPQCSSDDKPDCGWCVDEGFCGIATSCGSQSSFVKNETCPAAVSVSPDNTIDVGGALVTFTATYLPNSQVQCKFNDSSRGVVKYANSTRINATSVSCIVPSAAAPGNTVVRMSLVYASTKNRYTRDVLSFTYFNCDLSASCSSCLQGQCYWCISSANCYGLGDFANTTCLEPISVRSSCPRLISVTPSSSLLADSPIVTLQSSYLTSFEATQFTYNCEWKGPNNQTYIFPGTRTSVNSLTCQAVPLPQGVSTVGLLYKNKIYAEPRQTFFRYDCSQNSCGQCVGANKPQCGWCVNDNTCIVRGTQNCTQGVQDTSQCPNLISISPSISHIEGNITVYVFASPIVTPIGRGYECKFGTVVVNATVINGTSLSCVAPAVTTSGNYDFTLLLNGVPFSPQTKTFRYFVCDDLDGSCGVCLSAPQCGWCLPYDCYEKSIGPSCAPIYATNACPVITRLIPDHAPIGPVTLSVIGGPFSVIGYYECSYNGVRYPATINSDSNITCTILSSTPQISPVTIMLDGQQYITPGSNFEYYDCSFGNSQQDCTGCSFNPSQYCVWCLNTQTCGTAAECPDTNLATTCPVVSNISPTYGAVEGGTLITITGTGFAMGYNFTCRFGTIDVPAIYQSKTQLTCVSPVFSSNKRQTVKTVSLAIFYNGRQFTSNTVNYDFLDCGTGISTRLCSDCAISADPRCTWCSVDNYCAPVQNCNPNWPSYDTVLDCPVLTSLSPLVGPLVGNTEISLIGSGFFNFTEGAFQCTFGNVEVNATFVNSSVFSCLSPPTTQSGQVQVFVSFNGKKFTTNQLAFQYQDPVAETIAVTSSGTDNTALIASVTVIGSLCVIGSIFAAILFIIIRRRNAKIKLQEPDYAALAFSGAIADYDVDRDKAEKLGLLEELLLESDFSLVTAICEITQVSDVDQVTKAIVYVYESKNQTINLLKYFITREVHSAESEASLFRANSIVCKMTSHYAKMVGLPYLWVTLALPVHELNDLGRPDAENSGRYDTDSKRGMASIMTPTSMEVDPTKMDEEADAAVNQLQLMLISQKLFGAITRSVDHMPPQLRDLYSHVKMEVSRRFPENVYKAVAGFLFLRFICPSILAPHVYGLLPEPPNQDCQRYLILLSKTLQNLALGTLPGKKEDYMQKMNDFITTNQDNLHKFIDNVTESDDQTGQAVDLPKDLRNNSLAFLHQHISINVPLINRYCDEQTNGKELHEKMGSVLNELGMPLIPKSV